MSTDQPTGNRSERLTRRQRAAVAAGAALAVAVAGSVAVTTSGSGPDDWPPAGTSACTSVQIFTGSPGTPYNQFARVLRVRLEAAPEHFDVDVVETAGSTENIYDLESPEGRLCGLAITQLNTAVDATEGVNQFDPARGGQAVPGLRSLGPVHDDLLHVIVRAPDSASNDVDITTFADLCHRKIATGRPGSGVRQIGDVLLRIGLTKDCLGELDDSPLDEALRELSVGLVDAVLWVGGAGTRQIRTVIANGAKLGMLDMSGYRDRITGDWDQFYRSRGHFFAGPVFGAGSLGPDDYPGISETPTVTVPNGLIAHTDADAALVRRATAELFQNRADYSTMLWGENLGGRTIPDALYVYESPLFCYIPLHPAAADYYIRQFQRLPRCGETPQ